jgi:hypothetical protein
MLKLLSIRKKTMSQSDIIKYLIQQKRRKRENIDIVELIRVIPANRGNISRACRKLRENKEIKSKPIKKGCFVKYVYSI